jgi:hypothetical protein
VDSKVESVFQNYPLQARQRLLQIRADILSTAIEYNIEDVEETLKWGEPSYLVKKGSTVRIGWNLKKPEHYGIYFNCQTRLIETIREVYGDLFQYEGNRAIVFNVDDSIPTQELRHCLSLALRYHRLKHLPLLGC